MSINLTRALAVTALATSLVVAGCGSDDEPAATTSASTPAVAATGPPAATIPAELVGTYERRITRADIKRTSAIRNEAGAGQEEPKPGPGRLVISASGPLRFLDLGVSPPFAIDQNVTATSSRLAIESYAHPEKGSFCGPEIAQNASYSLALDGGILTLKALDDPCADRDSTLTGAWRRR